MFPVSAMTVTKMTNTVTTLEMASFSIKLYHPDIVIPVVGHMIIQSAMYINLFSLFSSSMQSKVYREKKMTQRT